MFPTKILLATDDSEGADLAALRAVELARTTGSELHLVHVGFAPAFLAGEPGTLGYDRMLLGEIEDEAGELLRKLSWRVKVAGGDVAGEHLRMGKVDLEIVGLAKKLDADLIVMGSRGLGGMRRLVLGSVSESVARHAPCPVLVVRAEGVEAFPGKILLATDGSPEGKRATKAAMELADKLGSELHVGYVEPLPASTLAPEGAAGGAGASVLEDLERRGRRTLDEQVREIEEQGGTVAGGHLRVGRPDEEIVDLGEELEAGTVVVGSRGLGTLKRAVMGSVSESVVRHAFSPVLVVREGTGR